MVLRYKLVEIAMGKMVMVSGNKNDDRINQKDADGNPIYKWVELNLTTEQKMANVRDERNRLLAISDAPYMLPDYPLTDEQRQLLLQYRQALRELPNQAGFDPSNFNYPSKPDFIKEN